MLITCRQSYRLLHLDDEVLDDGDIVTDLMVLNPLRSSSVFPPPPIPRPDIVSLRIKYPRNYNILLSIMHNYIPHYPLLYSCTNSVFFDWLLKYPSLTLPCSLAVAIYFTLSADWPDTQTLQPCYPALSLTCSSTCSSTWSSTCSEELLFLLLVPPSSLPLSTFLPCFSLATFATL